MEITFNTQNAEATVALKALQQYKAKQFKEAIASFTEILDCEPGNWDARLLLGACYYKSGQFLTAQRIFNYINESCCTNLEARAKAREALRSVQSQLERGTTDLPAEFGCYNKPGMSYISASWLDCA